MGRQKSEYERSVFRRFASKAGLSIKPRSIRSPKPPRPDISCRVDGVSHYFELTRMVHPGSANLMGRHFDQLNRFGSAPPLGVDSYDDRIALRETIQRKAGKGQQTDTRPMVLLIYIDGVFHPAGMPSDWAHTILQSEGPQRQWTEIWLYDSVRDLIVAHWSQKKQLPNNGMQPPAQKTRRG